MLVTPTFEKICNGFRAVAMAALAAISCVVVAQQTDPIPDVYLAVDHKDCMSGCVPGFGEKTCKPLCDCTVSQFKQKLSFDQYKDMRLQISRNEVLPDMRIFLDDVAKICTAELDQQGVVVGEPKVSK